MNTVEIISAISAAIIAVITAIGGLIYGRKKNSESEVKHVESQETIKTLEHRLTKIEVTQESNNKEFESINRKLDRLLEFHLKEGTK